MRKNYTLILILLSFISSVKAQKAWFKVDSTTALSVSGESLRNPWAGGLNASQFGKMDLNGDQIEDLVVFDRTTSKFTTFLAVRSADQSFAFQHAPYYEAFFPAVDNWMVLADYNKDGRKDLFASTALGVVVYKNVAKGNGWTWELASDALYTQGFSGAINLQVSGTDIPGIIDIDDDGDLDVITFDYSGTYIELHQNMSMERFGVPDSLGTSKTPVYMRNGECWGNFHKNDTEDGFVFGDNCGVKDYSNGRILHAGNSIFLHDLDGDGKRDLLVGHVTSENLSFIKNSASGIIGNFTSFSGRYPAKDPVIFHIFPSAFMLDVDFDGVDDLIAGTNVATNDANLIDFKSSNWYFHNKGTSNNVDFELVRKNFLQDQMLDVGENSAPSFYDIDGDGDADMIVGTGGVPGSSGFRGRLYLLTNKGTAKAPSYELTSDNYLNFPATLDGYNVRPQWADFNGDGVPDLGFTLSSFRGLEYRYIPNKGLRGQAAVLNLAEAVTITLPAGTLTSDAPYFYDADGDGDLDMLVGKAQGNVFYYTNTGTTAKPVFSLVTDKFADIAISYEGRSVQVSVADVDLDGRPDLITTDFSGRIRVFHSAEWGKWTSRETLLIERDGVAATESLGRYLHGTAADYNGDGKPDLVVGTGLGGVRLFTNILDVTVTGVEPTEPQVVVYPNPADQYIRIRSSEKIRVTAYTAGGATILAGHQVLANSESEIRTQNWAPGLYVLEMKSSKGTTTRKIVIR